MICLIFTNEQKALTAKNQIWYNYLLEQVQLDAARCIKSYAELQAMTPEDTSIIELYNYRNGSVVTNEGKTTSLVNYRPMYQTTNFWIAKPDVKYMTGVTDYSEDTYSE